MMTLKEIRVSARSLASQFRGNISMAEAISVMPTIQPDYAEFWEETLRSIEAGNPLSTSLLKVWPEALVSAVVAGEEAGKLEDVFARITKAVEIQLALRKQLMKLTYPIGIGVIGIIVFILIMVFVAPGTAKSFRAEDANAIARLALGMESFFKSYWLFVIGGVVAGGVLLVKWAQTEEGKSALLEAALSIPHLGAGLKDLYHGLWAEYMALMASAGIPTDRGVLLTVKVVPESLREAFLAFERDLSINNLPVQDAANIDLMREDDPRQAWPLFIRRALILGDRTGVLDAELQAVAPELVEQGVDKVGVGLFVANVGATALAALLVGMSFIGIYAPIIGAVKSFR